MEENGMVRLLEMIHKLVLLFLFLLASFAFSEDFSSIFYNGFRDAANLTRDGFAEITTNGLLRLTNLTIQAQGHAFYSNPFQFKNSSNGNTTSTSSFSATFVFAIIPKYGDLGGHGMAFVISKSKGIPGARSNSYLGLLNTGNNGNSSNQFVAVEIDTNLSQEFDDIDNNHVGIDINSLKSIDSSHAKYFVNDHGDYKNLTLMSGLPMQVWVEYDGLEKQLNITLAPIGVPKPNIPLLSSSHDLSPVISDSMYVGFSASTGSAATSHYILGWSFKMNGEAQALNLSKLPKLPNMKEDTSKILTIGLPIIVLVCVVMCTSLFYIIRRKKKFEEVLDDWELSYVPHRFSYKDLYIATKGFSDKEVLGIGGFGKVYKGVLPKSKLEVGVKRISHESKQGMREFIAEIVSMGQLRHRNLVQLLGYCRRKGELLLVYDFMPNGSLDKYLFGPVSPLNPGLNWCQRYQIIKGVASGLVYLHEEWEQVVIHRDIKAGNVLIDGELNGRLGDFGLARLYDHGTTDPQTTNIVGTLGYLAPEMSRTGKATTSTDVFAFGALLLEVACGRRPIERGQAANEDLVLVDWVYSCWKQGTILEATDPKLGTDFVVKEMELVLKLGLLCLHAVPSLRPTMRHVMQILDGTLPLPDLVSISLHGNNQPFSYGEGFDDFVSSYPTSIENGWTRSSSTADSLLSHVGST